MWQRRNSLPLADVPSGTVVELQTIGGGVHYLLPFRPRGELRVAIYNTEQRTVFFGNLIGAKRSSQAQLEPWLLRKGSSLVLEYHRRRQPYTTSPIIWWDRCDDAHIMATMCQSLAIRRLLSGFGPELRPALRQVITEMPLGDAILLLTQLAGMHGEFGPEEVLRITEQMCCESPAETATGERTEFSTLRMGLGQCATVVMCGGLASPVSVANPDDLPEVEEIYLPGVETTRAQTLPTG